MYLQRVHDTREASARARELAREVKTQQQAARLPSFRAFCFRKSERCPRELSPPLEIAANRYFAAAVAARV